MASENPTFIPNLDARQCIGSAIFELTSAQFLARGNVIDLRGPPGSQVIGGDIVVGTAFNTTGSDTLSIGDADVANRYANAVNLKSAARTALTVTGFKYTASGATVKPFLRLTRTRADDGDTAGLVRVRVDYVTLDKSEWTEG